MIRILLILFSFSISNAAEISGPMKCLWSSYKNFKITADRKDIVFPSGTVLPFESRSPAGTPVNRHKLTSIDQMFLSPYQKGFPVVIPTKKNELVGARYANLFFTLYGHSPSNVESDLVTVKWVDGSSLEFNQRYGAASALRRVVKTLIVLIHNHPEYKKFLYQPIGGTYNWRKVSGQNNPSMHSFGVALDIGIRFSDYWKWELGSDKIPHYRNRIPSEIAKIFESYGFIWGGKWYHYDTMHFEYRPELLMSEKTCDTIFEEYKD